MREDVLRYELIHRLTELADRLDGPDGPPREHRDLVARLVELRDHLAGFGLMEVHEPQEQP